MQAARSSWRKLTGDSPQTQCECIYEAIIRPALTYGGECWAMKVTNTRKIATTEMRMLRGIIGVSRRDHMRNEEIRRILHLSPIDEVMHMLPSSLVWTCPEKRCEQRHPQSDGAGNTRYQTTRTLQEDMTPTDEGRHGWRGCYP